MYQGDIVTGLIACLGFIIILTVAGIFRFKKAEMK
jgi:hypothetical protein